MYRQLETDKMVIDEYSNCTSAIFVRRHPLEQASRTLAAQRDALLPKLVSGKVGVGLRCSESISRTGNPKL